MEVESSFCEAFGYHIEDMTGRALADFLHPADRELLRSRFRKREAGRISEARFLHRDQLWRHVQLDWRPLEGKPGCAVAVQDVSGRRQAEDEWRMMSGVFENALDGMAQFDSNGVHIRVNRSYAVMHGYAPGEMIGMDWQAIIPAEVHGRMIDAYVAMMTGGRHVLESRAQRKDGTTFHRETVMIPAHDGDGAFAGHHAFTRDITSRIEAEQLIRESRERMRELTGHLQRVREEERTRIAREIHDNLGQNMTALKMEIGTLSSRFRDHIPRGHRPHFSRRSQGISQLLDATVNLIRQIASDLRPGVLDLGLGVALEWQATQFAKRGAVRCRVDSKGLEREPGPDVAIVVFRIFQELLTNVARHAQATRIQARLDSHGRFLMLRVHDNGRGITASELGRSRSLGLLGMRERASSIGGTLVLQGDPSTGTTALLTIPLDPPRTS